MISVEERLRRYRTSVVSLDLPDIYTHWIQEMTSLCLSIANAKHMCFAAEEQFTFGYDGRSDEHLIFKRICRQHFELFAHFDDRHYAAFARHIEFSISSDR